MPISDNLPTEGVPTRMHTPWANMKTFVNGLETAIGTGAAGPHTHPTSDVTGLDTALAGKVSTTRTVAGKALSADVTLVKADVGLPNVDNTSDAAKPVSTAAQTALDAKADTTALAGYVPAARTVAGKPLSGNVTLAKADVGLGNVDNTSDAAKPISTATQAAIAYMVTSPNDTVRTIERHGSQAAIPTPYVAKRVYLVPDEA